VARNAEDREAARRIRRIEEEGEEMSLEKLNRIGGIA